MEAVTRADSFILAMWSLMASVDMLSAPVCASKDTFSPSTEPFSSSQIVCMSRCSLTVPVYPPESSFSFPTSFSAARALLSMSSMLL